MRLLVFGLTGQIGIALQARWKEASHAVVAVSRNAQAPSAIIEWRRGEFTSIPVESSAHFDAVLSLGPLDAFARWLGGTSIDVRRIVAIGSTSLHTKRDSPDPAERDIVARLAHAEAALEVVAAERGVPCFVLRPTLVWGAGRDRSLSRVAAMARHWPLLPIPMSASGLRQPVHVADLAAVVEVALHAPAEFAGKYDLPGGETITLADMLRRAIRVAGPRCLLVPVPNTLFSLAMRLRGQGHPGWLARARQDLVFDGGPARDRLGWRPRGFDPTAPELGLGA